MISVISEIYSKNQLKRTIDEMIKLEEDKIDKNKILIENFKDFHMNGSKQQLDAINFLKFFQKVEPNNNLEYDNTISTIIFK